MANVYCHGTKSDWDFNKYPGFYSDDAKNLKSEGISVITTIACNTNDFGYYIGPKVNNPDVFRIVGGNTDYIVPKCLSMEFLKNPDSGVIQYLGSTQEGVGKIISGNLDGTHLLVSDVYQYVFSNKLKTRRISECLAEISDYYGRYLCMDQDGMRWCLTTMNLCGDPETEIFINPPKNFDEIRMSPGPGNMVIITGLPSDAIVRTGTMNINGIYEFREAYTDKPIKPTGSEKYCTLGSGNTAISITCQGYIPLNAVYTKNTVRDKTTMYIQNQEIRTDMSLEAPLIRIGNDVTATLRQGKVVIENARIDIDSDSIMLESGTAIKSGSKLIKK